MRPGGKSGSVFVAREEQLALFENGLRSALKGHLRIIVISGEPGAGKTAFLDECVNRSRAIDSTVLSAGSSCYTVAGSQEEPFLPFLHILDVISNKGSQNSSWEQIRRGITDLAPDWLQVLPGGDFAAAVIRTAQWRQRKFGDGSGAVEIRRRLVQYTNALSLVAKKVPLLLWIDDLQWSDNASLDLLAFIADHAAEARILILLTYRSGDVAADFVGRPHPVRKLVSKLARYEKCVETALAPFGLNEVQQFLTASSHRFPAEFVKRLWRQSGGNPLFLRECVSLLHLRRQTTLSDGYQVLQQPGVEIDIPLSLASVVGQRLDGVGTDLRRLLRYASVQGVRFSSHVLAELLESNELAILESLGTLSAVYQLVRESTGREFFAGLGVECEFVHALVQQLVYDELGVGLRRYLHLAVARSMEASLGTSVIRQTADLARHFELGGDAEKAIGYYIRASRHALGALALDDAVARAQSAAVLIDKIIVLEHSEVHDMAQIEAIALLVEGHYLLAEYEIALSLAEKGEDLCAAACATDSQARFMYFHALILEAMGDDGDALQYAKRAIAALGENPSDKRLQGDLYAYVGGAFRMLPPAEIEAALTKGFDLARKYDLPETEVRVLLHRAWIAAERDYRSEEVTEYCKEALAIADRLNYMAEQIVCHRLLAHSCRRMGLADEALAHNHTAVAIARRSGLPMALHISLNSLAITQRTVLEDWNGSLSTVRESLEIAHQHEFAVSRYVLDNWFAIVYSLGRWEDARRVQDHLSESASDTYRRGAGFQRLREGHLAYGIGSFRAAAEEYTESIQLFEQSASDARDAKLVEPFLGLALVAAGHPDAGLLRLEAARSFWKDRHPAILGQVLHGIARSQLANGDFSQAISNLEEAQRLTERRFSRNIWPTAPYVCVDLGAAFLALGRNREALDCALRGYRKFKAWHHFLCGEAALMVGRILLAEARVIDAVPYLKEARSEWERLGLTYQVEGLRLVAQAYGVEFE